MRSSGDCSPPSESHPTFGAGSARKLSNPLSPANPLLKKGSSKGSELRRLFSALQATRNADTKIVVSTA